MTTILQRLRQLSRRAAQLLERSAPYLLAADPSRPPPTAIWPSLWRLESRPPDSTRRAAEPATPTPEARNADLAPCCAQ